MTVYISTVANRPLAWKDAPTMRLALLDADPEPAVEEPAVVAEEPVDAVVRDLVARAQAGNVEAFGEIYDRYMPTVHRFVWYRTNDRHLTEDLTAETFVRAFKRIKSFTWQGRDFGAWLSTIARHLVADYFKSSRYRLETTVADVLDVDQADTSAEGPEDAAVNTLTNETLMAAVRQLNPDQRACINLRFIQGLSVTETAEAMGKNPGAIKALQYRAVNQLAKLLPEGFHPATRRAVRSAGRRRPVPAPEAGGRQ